MTDEIKEKSPEERRRELVQETEHLLAGINIATGVNFNDPMQYLDIIDQGLDEHVTIITEANRALSHGHTVSYRPVNALLQASDEQQLEYIVGSLKGAVSSTVRDQEIAIQIREEGGNERTVIAPNNDIQVGLNRDKQLTAVVPNKLGTVDVVAIDEKYFPPQEKKKLNYKVASRFMSHDLDLRRATPPSSAPKTTPGK